MILVDGRIGSKELAPLIPDSLLVRLEYGDVSFQGKGPKGVVEIGIERKTISDLISSISSGRLSGHQLPGLISSYFKVYIIIEGIWRRNKETDVIEVPTWNRQWKSVSHGIRTWKGKDLWAYLNSLQVITGVIVRTSPNIGETVSIINGLCSWWQKPWEKHHAHVSLYCTPQAFVTFNPGGPSLLTKIAAQLPGVGYQRAKAVADYFEKKSVQKALNANDGCEAMMLASIDRWAEISGIGKVIAKGIYEAIHK